MRARLFALVFLAVLSRAAAAASADPSLMPEFDRRRRPPKPAAAPRQTTPEAAPAPAEGAEAPASLPATVLPSGQDRPDQRWEVVDLPRREWIVLRERTWILSGSHESRFAARANPAAFTVLDGASEDAWDGHSYNTWLRGALPMVEAEVAPLSFLSVVGEYGTSAMRSRGWTDSAWLNAPHMRVQDVATGYVFDHAGHAETSHVSASAASARTTWASASVAIRLVENRGGSRGRMEYDHSVDLLVGAHRFSDEFTASDGVVDRDNGQVTPANPLGTRFPGPDLHQRALWRGPHVGLRLDSETQAGLGLHGTFLWSPLMEYRGDVDDLIAQRAGTARGRNPTTIERAHGTAAHLRLGVSYRVDRFAFEAGWMRLYFYSRTGLRRTYAPNGTSTDQLLEHAITERSGFYAGASVRF